MDIHACARVYTCVPVLEYRYCNIAKYHGIAFLGAWVYLPAGPPVPVVCPGLPMDRSGIRNINTSIRNSGTTVLLEYSLVHVYVRTTHVFSEDCVQRVVEVRRTYSVCIGALELQWRWVVPIRVLEWYVGTIAF